MSAVLDSEDVVPDISPKSGAIEIREGDWKAYMQCIARSKEDKAIIDRYGSVAAYKRACAMAYLGKRAQIHGGVCSTRHPHIITPQFIADLETNNRSLRYTRYPWLRSLMSLLAEIEQIQDQISSANVITLVPASK
ncbi:MAG TPA: hypothetical protein VJ698_10670 [Noviherbaspirillum sp.]|uniref:hypothetical protein n=1 Tax=Noviherbaspirillum sp. TaxID=1926288 RepID=UPI002B492F59|nr:hypothetical protein [Noviherbaspirillum sp.]HJV85929.1 hypothetical protein [Noviherbaspirillum sp.]